MGIFDFLKGSAKDATAAGAATAGAAVVDESAVSKLLGMGGGQLTGLLDKLNVGGLDDVVKSWISKGENKPVSAEQVKAALGPDEIGKVASEMGVSQDVAAGKIAKYLPGIIDKLTPDGMVPDADALATKVTGLFK